MSGAEYFRITIEGHADPEFFGSLVEQAKQMTPVDGGFTMSVGTRAEGEDQREKGREL
ncbi:hypothetical protein [Microbacterium sp. ZXX196]|uniref:hypothetical protein n=1 Tax=Microbacterium sp. ZXX196 TaxID=2609291 RepID=UPI0012BA03A2|nr:hypothetical protein [Microbacterium sp. ZXX196]MTE24844.1 hypothetical protein [Microbacterium sp. ZXX196]